MGARPVLPHPVRRDRPQVLHLRVLCALRDEEEAAAAGRTREGNGTGHVLLTAPNVNHYSVNPGVRVDGLVAANL